jgi:hypothetical protein
MGERFALGVYANYGAMLNARHLVVSTRIRIGAMSHILWDST